MAQEAGPEERRFGLTLKCSANIAYNIVYNLTRRNPSPIAKDLRDYKFSVSQCKK